MTERELCGKWLPRAKEHCALALGHAACHRTEAGKAASKAASKAYEQSEAGKAVRKAYSKAYEQSEAGKAVRKAYAQSEAGWLSNLRYDNSVKGILRAVRSNAKQRGNG